MFKSGVRTAARVQQESHKSQRHPYITYNLAFFRVGV